MADFLSQNKLLAGVVGLSLTGLGVAVYFARTKKQPTYNRKCGVDYPKDTVIVQAGLSKGKYVPTAGQFNLKLMTYLRAAGIPYKAEFSMVPGPKGKIPWMEYNDTVMGDSQLIINFCNKTFNKDLNQSLSKEERALAWAIQKWIEEFLYCDTLQENFEYAGGVAYKLRFIKAFTCNKKYIMGDQFTEVDSSAFGIIASIYYQTPAKCVGRQLLMHSAEMKNVRDYLERIKTHYWPDWDELTMK